MSGLIAAFHNVCIRIPNLRDSEILDYFVEGFKLSLFKRVMEKAPKTFEGATRLAQCTGLAQ